MARYRSVLATTLLGVALVATGCKGKPADDEASIKETLQEKGTIDVMEQVSNAPEYKAPADGKLTDPQVKMYLEVRQREQKIREVAFKELKAKGDKAKEDKAKGEKKEVGMFEAMKAIGDLADVATADLRAAQELGHNPKEYTWVKERVMEVQLGQTTKALNQQMAQGQQAMVKMLETQKTMATDDAQRTEIDQQIEQLKANAAEATSESQPGQDFNAELIAKYKADFDKLQDEFARINQELQKGSNPQGGGQ